MPDYFRAVAVDFDGTLTSGGRPADDVLHAIANTRAAGRRVVLVTGRILTELRVDFPDADQWSDAMVAGTVPWSAEPLAGAASPHHDRHR